MKAVLAIRFRIQFILLAGMLAGAYQQTALAGGPVVIAGWDVLGIKLDDGNHVPPYRINAHTSAVQLTKVELTLSPNVNNSTATNSYGFKIDKANRTDSLDAAIQSGHFFEISLQVAAGYRMHLDSLDIVGQSTSTGCDDIAVLSDVDGFVTNGVIDSVTRVSKVPTGGFDARSSSTNGFGGPIILSDKRFSELKSIRIRLYGWNSSATHSDGPTSIRNLAGYDLNIFGTIEKLPSGTVFIVQ